MRVGLISFLHESNTFASALTGLDAFEQDHLLAGEPIRAFFHESHHEVGGFLAGLADASLDAVPIFAARATPSGMISATAMDAILDRMLAALATAGHLDGLLLAAHGATVSENYPDADGEWLSRVRDFVGPGCPLVCTIDPHANISHRMIEACNATIAYRTNPHVDQHDRGCEAATLMARTLRQEVRPAQAASFPPMAINIERQRTDASPCKELYELADAQVARPRVLSNSVGLGFPYADVAEMGSAFIVVTDDDQELARSCAHELATRAWHNRQAFAGQFTNVADAIEQASQSAGPVLLLDMGDNVGGGGPGDGTLIASAILERGSMATFVCLCDPESVSTIASMGIGTRRRLQIGGKTDDRHGPPLDVEVKLKSLHDGRFEEPQPRHGGWTSFDMGPTAVVETAGSLTIMVTTHRVFPVSLVQLTSCDLDPTAYQIIVAKGVQAPVAAYQAVCRRVIRVNTPGVTTADMTQLEFKNRRCPMFPFEPDTRYCE